MKFRLPLIIPIIFLSGCDINHIKKDIVNKNTPSPKKNMLIGSKKIKSQHVAMSTTRNYAKMAIITRTPINNSRNIKYHAAQWSKKKPAKSSYPQRKLKTPIKTALKTSRYPVADNYIPEQSINNFTVYFGFDKSTILPVYNTVLQAIAGSLTDNPDSMATVKAYTDSIGKTDYNQKLSERRAIAIKKELINYGIASYKIHAFAYGESSKFDNYTTYGRAKNRRTEIQISDVPIVENDSELQIKKVAEVKVATTKKTRGLKFKKNITHKNTKKVKISKKKTDSKKKLQKEKIQRKATQRKEAQRKEAQRKEAQRKEAQRKEAQRKEAQRKEAQRKEAQRKEAQRKEAQRKKAQRKEAQRKEAQRKEAQRKETQREKDQKSVQKVWNKIKEKESSNEISKKKTDLKKKRQKETAKRKATQKKEAQKKETQREKDQKSMQEGWNKINKINKNRIKQQSKRLSKKEPKMSKKDRDLVNAFSKKVRLNESKKRK